MKKLIDLFLLLAAACIITVAFAFAADVYVDLRPKLAESTDEATGIMTTTYVGAVDTRPQKDGTATLRVFPVDVKTINGYLVSETDVSVGRFFEVPLTSPQYASINAIIKAKWDADHAEP